MVIRQLLANKILKKFGPTFSLLKWGQPGKNPFIKMRMFTKSQTKNIHIWMNGEQFCAINIFLRQASKFFKDLISCLIWTFFSKCLHVIFYHTYQQASGFASSILPIFSFSMFFVTYDNNLPLMVCLLVILAMFAIWGSLEIAEIVSKYGPSGH